VWRGDSHYGRVEAMEWAEDHHAEWVDPANTMNAIHPTGFGTSGNRSHNARKNTATVTAR
jgi:hypothetical protein